MVSEKKVDGSSPLNELAAWTVGTHTFTQAATEFVATVVIPAAEPGVRGLLTEQNELLTGDVWLVGNAGVVLSAVDPSTIRVDVVGVPLFKRFVCAPQTEFPTKKFLKTINGCGPDPYGNFTITSTEKSVDHPAIRVYPINGTLTLDTIGPRAV
jgi:hypothetical protein